MKSTPSTIGVFIVSVAIVGAAFVVVERSGRVPSAEQTGQPPGPDLPRRDPSRPPRGPASPEVPFPGSLDPYEVVQNVKAIAQSSRFAKDASLAALAMESEDLRVRRIIEAIELVTGGRYIVVDLEDQRGRAIAAMAMTLAGEYMMLSPITDERLEDGTLRQKRSMDLEEAKAAVARRRNRTPHRAEYVWFPSVAEPGITLLSPLGAVYTENGTIYFNTKGEAFVDDGSPLADELRAAPLADVPGASKSDGPLTLEQARANATHPLALRFVGKL